MTRVRAIRPATWTLILIAAAVSALMWPTMIQLSQNWAPSPENVLGHGWLLLAIIGWAVFVKSRDVQLHDSRPRWLPLALLLILGIFWVVALNASIAALQALAWFVAILVAVWAVLGWEALRQLWWPLSLLVLLLPVWGLFHGLLWSLSVKCVGFMVGLFGIPFYMDRNTVRIASGSLEIASGCAGLSFFTVAVSVAFVIGYFNRATWRQHVVLVVSASIMAMVSNWVRITIIVWRAEVTQMQTTLITEDHYVFGWVVFAVGLLGYCFLFGSYGLNRDKSLSRESVSSHPYLSRIPWMQLSLAGTALIASPIWAAAVTARPQSEQLDRLSVLLPGSLPTKVSKSIWRPTLLGPDNQVSLEVVRSNLSLLAFEASYHRQRQGREMIGEGNLLVPDESWGIQSHYVDSDSAVVIAVDGVGNVWLIRYGYAVGDWRSAKPVHVQIRLGISSLFENPVSRFTAIAVHCNGKCETAQQVLLLAWREISGVAPAKHAPTPPS